MFGEPRLDPVANPYAPGAGTPPPALVGRDVELESARVQLERLRAKRTTQHLMLTGLRGVGKTVLLHTVAATARQRGFHVLRVEATGREDAIDALLRRIRRLLEDLRPSDRRRRALRTLDAISVTVAGTGLRLERRAATAADPGLVDLLLDVVAAADHDDAGVMLAVDEAQLLDTGSLGQLLTAVHTAGQDSLPLWAALAGLPNLLGVVSKARTYAERMFLVAELGALGPVDADRAVREPALELGERWADDAVEAVVAAASGYPYFLQVWAYHCWNATIDDPISVRDVERAAGVVRRELDDGFFASRVARVPASELRYLRALAELGPGAHRSRDVAARLGLTTPQVGALRDRLIGEGLLFAPAYGHVQLALPDLDDHLRRST
jgi:hypothetical protein